MTRTSADWNGADFFRLLREEEACRDYFFSLKYPDGYRCACCGGDTYWITARDYLHCQDCGTEVSLGSGTLFEGIKKPLPLLFRAIYLFVSMKSGITARDLGAQLGLSSYQTAWAWLSRIREAAGAASARQLSGTVEIDQIFYPQPGDQGPVVIATAIERGERNRLGSVRMEVLGELSAAAMSGFIDRVISPGSSIICDGWNVLSNPAFSYAVVEKQDPEGLLPAVRIVAEEFRLRTVRSHRGPVNLRQLYRYLGEFQFRFNYRKERNPRVLFHIILSQAVRAEKRTFRELTCV